MQEKFFGGFCDDGQTQATINRLFKEDNYLCDTHTAVAVKVCGDYIRETGDGTPCVIASTASPFKFAADVLPAISGDAVPEDGFELLDKLSEESGVPVPKPLAELKNRPVLHKTCVKKESMAEFIRGFLA